MKILQTATLSITFAQPHGRRARKPDVDWGLLEQRMEPFVCRNSTDQSMLRTDCDRGSAIGRYFNSGIDSATPGRLSPVGRGAAPFAEPPE